MEESGVDAAEWVRRYAELRPTYEQFGTRLAGLLSDLLVAEGIEQHAIEVRTKSPESFREKLERPGQTFSDPLSQVTDLAGARIIVYYQEDVARVCSILEREFLVDRGKSTDKGDDLGDQEFGYLSVHYVVYLAKHRQTLREWKRFEALAVEIQVRTVLQHAWAAISHKLQYKRATEIPKGHRRRLVRLAGILELADAEFSELRAQDLVATAEVAETLSRNDLSLPIDLISVTAYVRTSDATKSIEELLTRLGYGVSPPSEDADQLTTVAVLLGYKTIADLDGAIRSAIPKAGEFLGQLFGTSRAAIIGDLDHWGAVLVLALRASVVDVHRIKNFLPWDKHFVKRVLGTGIRTWPSITSGA